MSKELNVNNVVKFITDKRRLSMERRVALTLVRDILAAGHTISVYDSPALRSRDKRKIMEAMAASDEDTLFIRDAAGNNLGVVTLVYGNDGWDVISDHTDTPAMNALLANANAYADALAG